MYSSAGVDVDPAAGLNSKSCQQRRALAASQVELLPEHVTCLLAFLTQAEVIWLRAIAKIWIQGVALGTVQISCRVTDRPESLKSLVTCLKKLPNVKLLDLQRSCGLRSADLALILAAMAEPSSVNVSFAKPLEWHGYEELQQQFSSVSFQDVLGQGPCVNLSPKDVIFLQCYALHAGRIDVCFNHASVSNRASTGPLARFSKFFEPSAPYGIMLHSEVFTVGEAVGRSHDVANVLVEFEKGGIRRLFEWQVSLQSDGCWATDSVGPASWHDVMLAELEE